MKMILEKLRVEQLVFTVDIINETDCPVVMVNVLAAHMYSLLTVTTRQILSK